MTKAARDVRSLRVLLVENHVDTRLTLTMLLSSLGHQVRGVGSLAEARQAWVEFDPEVLLSDIGLPDGYGWELLAGLPEAQRIFAIAMSGYGMKADCERSLAAGFRHHLVKPIAVELIESALDEAVHQVPLR